MSQVIEEWRPVPGYEGLYDVSNTGQIRRSGKILRLQTGPDRYRRIQLWKCGKYENFLIHRLVAPVFLGPIPNGYEVNHKSGDKSDNSVFNLEYVTRSENNRHAYRLGLKVSAFKLKGESHFNAKLTKKQVQEIRSLYRPRNRLFSSVVLARQYGVDHTTILSVVKHETWNS